MCTISVNVGKVHESNELEGICENIVRSLEFCDRASKD